MCLLSVFLKEFKELAFLKDAGILFHNLGPAIGPSITIRLSLRSRDLK